MKKFIMITPLQPIVKNRDTGKKEDLLKLSNYEAIGNSKLEYNKATRFPLMHLLNGYADRGEEIQVITITPAAEFTGIHLEQLKKEVAELQAEKGFIYNDVTSIDVKYAGNVETQIEIFQKLLPYFEDDDILFGCLTFGDKPMPIAEMMAIQYAYRVLKNVTVECLVYGELDHSIKPAPARIFDITALIQLDEIVRVLASRKVADPRKFLDALIESRNDDGKV